MTNPYLIAPSFDAVPHKIDNIRWTWAGDLLRDLGHEAAAERCYGFAAEHRMVAATLSGERQIGEEAA